MFYNTYLLIIFEFPKITENLTDLKPICDTLFFVILGKFFLSSVKKGTRETISYNPSSIDYKIIILDYFFKI